jgi:dolichyl-phosphate-mannose-protein mannosyltransferase
VSARRHSRRHRATYPGRAIYDTVHSRSGAPAGIALRPLLALGAVVALVLIVFAGGYGYHRDELYFLACGEHLSWGFADQGPLTPFIAKAMDTIAPGSLTLLRTPSALMMGGTVVLTGALASELGGRRRAQLIAAACMAVASILLIVGHLLSTTTFDLLAWTAVAWLAARALRTGNGRLWPLAGLLAGLGLLNKPLIAFLLAGLGVGLLLAGPRQTLRSPWLWAGAAVALLLWAPWLAWQAAHGWPQLDVSSAVANGSSTSSKPRWAFLPFQLLLVSPLLAPVWIAGLVALLRRPGLRRFRFFGVAWLFLAAVFLLAGGKPYYLAGLFPVLLGAGAIAVDAWLERGSPRLRKSLLGAALVASAIVSAVLGLPLLPAHDAGPVVAMNSDAGETIGWPQMVATVAAVYRRAPAPAVIFTSNYGEAGAIDRYGPALGLPDAYSGHNAFAEWGPPPDRPAPVVVVGLGGSELAAHFAGCRLAARVDNAAGIDNDESGSPVDLCAGTRRPWSRIWSGLRHLN